MAKWYRITRQLAGSRPVYDAMAATEEAALAEVGATIGGGPLSRDEIESIREVTIDEIRQDMIDAGYTPHV